MSDPKSPKPKKIKKVAMPRWKLPDDMDATYANLVRIGHTPAEMVFDFSRLLPGDTQAIIRARVLMTPLSAKLFHKALEENLSRYESVYGEIAIPKKRSLADYLFQPPKKSDEEPEE